MKKAVKKANAKPQKRQNDNTLPGDLLMGVFPNLNQSVPLSQSFQLSVDNSYNPITLNRILLTYAYMTFGVIQTVIDQPVEDAFRDGLKITSHELDADDINDFQKYLGDQRVLDHVKQAMKWARLFGGAGIIINTDQDPTTPLDEDAIGPDAPLAFLAADRWELTLGYPNPELNDIPYNYYGQPINKTRVLRVLGKEAPSYLRQRLQGWGLSYLECMLRPIQMFSKAEDTVYELIDEAKIDVMKIDGYNSSGLSAEGRNKTNERLTAAGYQKNYRRMLAMDKEDDYQQKQISFSGLEGMIREIRVGIASACKMPMTKIFGISAAGFSSGEDDIENYNSLVQSEVRAKAAAVLAVILPLCARQFFGREVVMDFEFYPLRMMSAEQEENVKNMKFNRYSMQMSQGMFTGQEYAEVLKQEELCPIDTKVLHGAEPIPPESSATFDKPQVPVKAKEAA